MSEHGHGGHCRDCGGTGGHHYNGCTYDGVDSGRSHRSSLPDSVREILLIGGVIFYGSVFDVGSVTDDNRFICIII